MELQLLGPIEVRLGDRKLQLGARKQRALLAMLGLHVNTAVSTDRLVEGLWGEEPPPSAAKMVQLYVSQLRRVLDDNGASIVTHGRGYELRLQSDWVDAALAAQGAEAAALWASIDRRLTDLAPAVPLTTRRSVILVSERVGNVQHHPLYFTLLDQLWVR
jgi:DNA-binding SARP family transcriptional activator